MNALCSGRDQLMIRQCDNGRGFALEEVYIILITSTLFKSFPHASCEEGNIFHLPSGIANWTLPRQWPCGPSPPRHPMVENLVRSVLRLYSVQEQTSLPNGSEWDYDYKIFKGQACAMRRESLEERLPPHEAGSLRKQHQRRSHNRGKIPPVPAAFCSGRRNLTPESKSTMTLWTLQV